MTQFGFKLGSVMIFFIFFLIKPGSHCALLRLIRHLSFRRLSSAHQMMDSSVLPTISQACRLKESFSVCFHFLQISDNFHILLECQRDFFDEQLNVSSGCI